MKNWIVIWLLGGLLAGCAEHDEMTMPPVAPADTTFAVSVADSVFSRFASFESLAVKVTRSKASEGTIRISTDADWLSLQTDTLPADGIISFSTTDNPSNTRREARLTFTANTQTAAITLSQLSVADDDENTDPAADGYLGYGYDIYQSIDNPMSVRKTHPVMSVDVLRTYSSQTTYEVVHENRLSRTEFNITYARSASEFAKLLTASASNTDVALMGFRQNVDMLSKVCRKEELMVSNYAYGTMTKAVWSRAIDRGALTHLRDRGKQLFTYAFQIDLQRVTGQTGSERRQALDELLDKYGTHVVMQADYGGKIDYTFCMTKSGSLRYDEEIRCQAEYTLGRLPRAEWDDQQQSALSSSKQIEGAINIKGGDPSLRHQLEQDVKGLGAGDGLPPEHMMQWLGSINYSDHPGSDESLEVIHFDIIPLWDLFTGEMRQEVMQAVMDRANKSNCKVSDAFASTDVYWLDITDALRFDKSLSRIVYVKGVPVLNVCQEYIPQIRADERVNVAYPIYNYKAGLTQGIFLGDGVHRPAYVMFGGDECYVVPIETLKQDAKLTELAYVGGNLYPERHDYIFQTVTPETYDDMFLYRYEGETHATPVVKVGPTFWTRTDIGHGMGFTPTPDSDDDVRDVMADGTLYTRFQYDVISAAQRANAWGYGYEPNTYFKRDNNRHWYLPEPYQVRQLYNYLGHSPKALFRGGVSGFEAAFHGYRGQADIENGNALGDNQHRGLNTLNIVASKAVGNSAEACLMVLDAHYHLKLITDATYSGENANQWRTNYYPVRLCRGACYEYPSLSKIKEIQNK